MAVLASTMAAAVASAKPRKTFTGEAWRSAMAPKISGETKAASAEAAKAKGLMACRPWASSTVLKRHKPHAQRRSLEKEERHSTRHIRPCESF